MSEENTYVDKFTGDLRAKLYGSKLSGASKEAELTTSWYENNLGFRVKTHVPTDKNDGVIRFGSDNNTSSAMLTMLIRLVTGCPLANPGGAETDTSWSFTAEKPGWDGAPAKLLNRLVIGRREGRYFIAIEEEGRPVPVFYFGPSQYHNVLLNKEPANPQQVSAIYAIAWAEQQLKLIPVLLQSYYEPVATLLQRWEERKKQRGNGGGNKGWNKPQGQQKPWGQQNQGQGNNKPFNKPAGEPVNPGELHDGTVKSLKDFGAFIQLSGGSEGLVYKAAINGDQNAVPSQLLTVGQPVKVRVSKINEKGQISLTMKGVQQPSGGQAPSAPAAAAPQTPAAPQYPDNFDEDIPF